MKVRDIKKQNHRIRWFSKEVPGDPWNRRAMYFLAYGDVRSHQKVRRSAVGQRALNQYLDEMAAHHKECKKIDRVDRSAWKKQRRLEKAAK